METANDPVLGQVGRMVVIASVVIGLAKIFVQGCVFVAFCIKPAIDTVTVNGVPDLS